MAVINFDASQVAPSVAPEAVPAGWYLCIMTASEMKPTKKNDGAYLETEYTIQSGEYHGRKLFDRMNLQNANQTAVQIAYETLSAICHAVGVIQVADSSQLHGRPLMVRVSLRAAGKGSDGNDYDATNEVKGYKAVDAAAAAAPSYTPAIPPAAPAAPAWQPPGPPAAPAAAPAWQPPAASQPTGAPPPQWQPPAQPAAQPPAQPAAAPWQAPAAQPAAPAAAPAATPPWAVPPK